MPAQVRLEADPDRLHQVLANLVANAVEHAPGSPVHLSAVTADGDHVELQVADHGPGVDQPERVFERFWSSNGTRAVPGGGAGLGLAIALWIVELHGGELRMTDNEPHGCRACVRLPARSGGST